MLLRVIPPLLEQEYNSVDFSFFHARMKRFKYQFMSITDFDIPFKEWLETKNADGVAYSVLNKRDQNLAKILYKEVCNKMRNEAFVLFHEKVGKTTSFEKVIDVLREYPQIFIINGL